MRVFETSSSRGDQITYPGADRGRRVVGWGECASPSDPYYCPETVETCWHILKDFLAPAVIGREWANVEELVSNYRLVSGNAFARAGLEMAWDSLAKREGKTLADLLGGTRREIVSGVSLSIERDPGRLLGLIEQYLGEDIAGSSSRSAPGRTSRSSGGSGSRFPTSRSRWTPTRRIPLDDIAVLKRLDEFHLLLIEQPRRTTISSTTPGSRWP